MKKPIYLVFPLLIFVVFSSLSCGKKNVPGIDTDEKALTIGKVTGLVSYPGRNRVKLSWKIPSDTEPKKFLVSWGTSNKDSKEVPYVKGMDQMDLILDELLEGSYTFSVKAIDSKANVSEMATVTGRVYGDEYEGGLVEIEVKDAIFNESMKTVSINWNNIGLEATGLELKYTDATNLLQTVSVSRFTDNTILTNFKSGNTFEYRTLYEPAGSIDVFYTSYKSFNVSQSDSFLGTDWLLYTPVKKIHLDDDVGLQTSAWMTYRSVCSPVICADYSYDSSTLTETFQILNSKSNRSEIRVEDNYSTGSRQFSGYVKFDAPLNDESLMQIFGSTSENATQLMIRGFSEGGGTLKISNSTVLATGIYNKEVHINVIHLQGDAGDKMIVYIDGVKKFEKVDGENATNYMKYGCYGTMKTGKAIVQWRDVKFYKNGKAPN